MTEQEKLYKMVKAIYISIYGDRSYYEDIEGEKVEALSYPTEEELQEYIE